MPFKVDRVTLLPGAGAFYLDSPAKRLPEPYLSQSAGMRTNASVLSVGLKFSDSDEVFWGDCVEGAPLKPFETPWSRENLEQTRDLLVGVLKGREFPTFRAWGDTIRQVRRRSLQYAVSQALLSAYSRREGLSPWRILLRDWQLAPPSAPLSLHGSCELDPPGNVDRILQARLTSLPAGAKEGMVEHVGTQGERLLEYTRWLKSRVDALGDPDYQPVFHFDLHGTLGQLFGEDFSGLCRYLITLEENSKPYRLRMEGPFLARDLLNQVHLFARLREVLEGRGSSIELIADEWATTREDVRQWLQHGAVHGIHIKTADMGLLHDSLETVQECREAGVLTLLGGSRSETELSVRTGIHLGMAVRPDLFVLNPSRNLGEDLSLITEEMNRILARSEEESSESATLGN